MAEFTPGKPVRSSEPSVRVDTLLASGRYRFRLVVLDNDRNASAPAELIVSVIKDAGAAPPTTPTTPVTPVTPVTPIISVTPVTPIIPTTLVMPTVPVTPSLSVAPKDEPTRKRRAPRRPKAAPARKRRTPRRPKS
jgi:hypothetical protein